MESFKAPEDITIAAAQAEIAAIMAEVTAMGANDYELPALIRLQNAVGRGEISPEAAVRQARDIRDSKQSYH